VPGSGARAAGVDAVGFGTGDIVSGRLPELTFLELTKPGLRYLNLD
jgi:hypothetical protein